MYKYPDMRLMRQLIFVLTQFCNGIEKLFRIFPAKTGICNRFSVYMVRSDLLRAFYQVAFDHDALNQLLDICRDQTAVQNFFDDTDLLFKFLSGVRVISVNDHCRILKVSFLIHFQKQLQILIVIIGNGVCHVCSPLLSGSYGSGDCPLSLLPILWR